MHVLARALGWCQSAQAGWVGVAAWVMGPVFSYKGSMPSREILASSSGHCPPVSQGLNLLTPASQNWHRPLGQPPAHRPLSQLSRGHPLQPPSAASDGKCKCYV